MPTALGLGVLLVPLALLIHATDSSGVNWAAGSSAGKLISKVRADVPHPVLDLVVVVVVALVVVAVAVGRRHPRTRPLADGLTAHWPVVFALCWLTVPVAAVVLLSLVYKPLLVVRYLVICLPPLVMLVAYGLSRLRRAQATGRWRYCSSPPAPVWGRCWPTARPRTGGGRWPRWWPAPGRATGW